MNSAVKRKPGLKSSPSWLATDAELLTELERQIELGHFPAGEQLGLSRAMLKSALKALLAGADVDSASLSVLAAFARPCAPPSLGVQAKFWQRRLALAAADVARGCQAVARIAITGCPGMRWAGSGWLVAERVLVTNLLAAQFLRSPQFGQTVTAEAQFEGGANAGVVEVLPDEESGLAFLMLDDKSPALPVMRLCAGPSQEAYIAAIGYAFQDSRMNGSLMTSGYGDIFDRLFVAPGRMVTRGEFFRHDCATAGNSAGALLLDLDSGAAAGIHISGFLGGVAVNASAIREAMKRCGLAEPLELESAGDSLDDSFFEAAVKLTPKDYADRKGYECDFLGLPVALPKPAGRLKSDLVMFTGPDGKKAASLPYTHFSVAMSKSRRLCLFVAVNIDGKQRKSLRRADKADRWLFDPRLERAAQCGRDIYRGGYLDLGHMVRRLDPVWGKEYERANDDTFHFVNACPQHKDLNRRIWNDLEDYILDNSGTNCLKATVFTGPVLTPNDPAYRGIKLPQQYWKVAVMIHPETGKLHATAYILSQADMITGLEFAFGEFRTYQLPVATLEEMTALDFGSLRKFDPKRARPVRGLESSAAPFTEIGSAADLVI